MSQTHKYCEAIQNHPIFGKSDINIVAFSQGNMISRYIIQECDLKGHKVHNYLSVGGPQQGVQKIPSCLEGLWCGIINFVVDQLVDLKIVQRFCAPASYYRETMDRLHYEYYIHMSDYLPYINNEKKHAKSVV